MRLRGSRLLVHSCVSLVGLTAFSGTATAGPQGDLIVNGSFEEPVGTGFYDDIPGWTPVVPCAIQGGAVQLFAGGADGVQAAELNVGCAGNGLSQTVATTPGGRYLLSFAFSARPGTTAADNQLDVRFDGELVDTIGPRAPGDEFAFTQHTYEVVASGSSTTLEFTAAGPASIVGTEIDAVTLVPLLVSTTPWQEFPGTNVTDDVVCPSADTRIAVGFNSDYTGAAVIVIHDGVPEPTQDIQGVSLLDVDCTDATHCYAVGHLNDGTAGVVLPIVDGAASEPIAVPGTETFGDIECADASTCYAVGSDGSQGAFVTLTDGAIGDPVTVAGTLDLANVDCHGASNCLATSQFHNPSTVVAIVDGTPGPAQPLAYFVNDVACAGEHTCVVVGFGLPDEVRVTAIADGIAGTTYVEDSAQYVSEVACMDASRCVAVGVTPLNAAGAVILITDGVPAPAQTIEGTTFLYSVTCEGSSCLGLGDASLPNVSGSYGVILAISDGIAGSLQYLPDGGTTHHACCGPGGCTIVGNSPINPTGGFTETSPAATPGIEATPGEDPVYAGGVAYVDVQVSGGFHPTGTVTFTLYGPGDDDCSFPIDLVEASLASDGMADAGEVPVGAAGTYNWIATYDGDLLNQPVATNCGDDPFEVLPQTKTGRAYGLKADGNAVIGAIHVPATPDTGAVETSESETIAPPCVASVPGPVSASNLCVSVATTDYPGRSEAISTVGSAGVSLLSIPAVTIQGVEATSVTTCEGSIGTTTIGKLKVGGTTVIGSSTQVAPNTKVNLGVVQLVLNEQIPFMTPDAGLTVNAVHVTINLGITHVDAVIGSAESDIADCP